MVKLGGRLLLALVLWRSDAEAADWSRAGGALFVGSAAIPAPASPGQGPNRLPAPSQPFGEEVAAAAERHGLDPKLLHALVLVESGYDPRAVSHAGAAGLTQLMPATAAELGVRDRFDPNENLAAGADYLARQLVRFGDLRLALAAFNAGPSRVARLGRVPDIEETRRYVSRVLECFLALSAGRSVRSARQCAAEGGLG